MILGPASIVDFTECYFRIPDGQHKGEPLLIRDVPWFRKPLEKIADDRVKIATVYKATGTGGTTIGEIGCAHRALKRPSNILWNTHIDNKVDESATRLLADQLDQIDLLTARYRNNRYDRDRIAERRFAFPPCRVVVQAANKSNAQSTRADCLFNDELWKYAPGIYEELCQRTTGDFPFSKIVNLTSAAEDPGQAAAIAFMEGDQDDYHLTCIHCGKLIYPTVGRESRKRYNGEHILRWDREGSKDHQASTVFMVCPYCDREIENTPKNRRDLLEGSDYVRTNQENGIEVYSCRFNSFIPWFEPWEKTILKWLKANEKAKYGSLEELRDFYVKALAITFDGRADANESPLYLSECYELAETESPIGDEKLWIAPEDDFEEDQRYMAVDYQRSGELWIWVAQADSVGNTRLIWAGRIKTDWAKVEHLRQFFDIDPGRVALDAGTDANIADLYENCARYGWTALNAENRQFFLQEEYEKESGEIESLSVRYPFSGAKHVGTYYRDGEEDPVHCRLILWDKNWISELFDRIRVGKAHTKLLLPANLQKLEKGWRKSERIEKQLCSMVYADPRQLKSGGKPVLKPKKIWTKRTSSTQEHFWDCASMVLVLMSIDGYFEEVIESRNENEH